jgi:hypothetical protein
VLRDPAAGAVGEAEAQRQAEHPDRDRARAARAREQVADQRRRGRRAGGFTHADAQARHDHLREVPREAGDGGEQAPHEDAPAQDQAPVLAVGQSSERHAHERVEQRERGAEQAQRGVAQRPFLAHVLADRAQDLAVEEVHQVDEEQHGERVARARGPRRLAQGKNRPRC